MSELEKLKAEHAALGRRIAKLEGSKPAPKRSDERGVTISYPVPPSTLVMPSDEQLHKLLDIVLAVYPRLAPAIELSFMQKLTLRNATPETARTIKPDVEAIKAAFFENFRACFVSIGGMKVTEEPDRRYFIGFHCDNARSWLKSYAVHTEIGVEGFICAVLAHGSIPYTDGSQNAQDGCVWECGLSPYSGRSVVDGWKHVLASGRLRQPCGPALRLQARSPSRVFGGSY